MSTQLQSQEETYYLKILDDMGFDEEKFDPERFRPCPGTILVVTPPAQKKTKGGVELPDNAQYMAAIRRVAAVPALIEGQTECPFKPGDWVVVRGEGYKVLFGSRTDLYLFQYTNDSDSDIFGFFPEQYVEQNLLEE